MTLWKAHRTETSELVLSASQLPNLPAESNQSKCQTCAESFLVGQSEADFYTTRGLPIPVNCPACRSELRARRRLDLGATPVEITSRRNLGTYGGVTPPPSRGPDNGQRFTAVCTDCGATAMLSFRPQPGRPVYCRKCFQARRNSA
jgi:CxxC-x17-CxxC domain-containing protein